MAIAGTTLPRWGKSLIVKRSSSSEYYYPTNLADDLEGRKLIPSSQTGRDHCVPETMHQPPLSIIIKVRDTKLIADIS